MMTCSTQYTQYDLAMELLIERGFEGIAESIAILMNSAMQLERSRHLNAAPYERSGLRKGYANGYKPKTMNTRVGEVQFAIPQIRGTDCYPQSLERGLRSERALKLALAEMYVQGVSTRKVTRITEALCGFEVSSSQVSRAGKLPDEQLSAWRNRPLPKESEAKRLLELFLEDCRKAAPDLVHWAETALPEGFTVFTMPSGHRKQLRTVNALERLTKEIKRRTRVATIFPNVESCLRLVTAVAMEISDDWEGSGRKYLQMDEFQPFCPESPSESPFRHRHFQVQCWSARLSRLRGTSTEGLVLIVSPGSAMLESRGKRKLKGIYRRDVALSVIISMSLCRLFFLPGSVRFAKWFGIDGR